MVKFSVYLNSHVFVMKWWEGLSSDIQAFQVFFFVFFFIFSFERELREEKNKTGKIHQELQRQFSYLQVFDVLISFDI